MMRAMQINRSVYIRGVICLASDVTMSSRCYQNDVISPQIQIILRKLSTTDRLDLDVLNGNSSEAKIVRNLMSDISIDSVIMVLSNFRRKDSLGLSAQGSITLLREAVMLVVVQARHVDSSNLVF